MLSIVLLITGCTKPYDPDAYRIYQSSYDYKITRVPPMADVTLFADRLCVPGKKNIGLKNVGHSVAEAGGTFNETTLETMFAKNIYKKKYPASTTKILTAYVAIKYGDLNEVFTVSENACRQAYDSSVAGLSPGDQLTLRELLYGLMLASGNDAAIVIAEGIDGTTEAFVKRMNREAKMLGATHSHFVTPNGLHDEDHYTTVYDMYLIFSAATKLKPFMELIKAPAFTAHYHGSTGIDKEKTWETTNYYLSGSFAAPDGIQVIGGKTGTTGQAGYCLVVLSKNNHDDRIISIVFHADCRSNLYHMMNEIMAKSK